MLCRDVVDTRSVDTVTWSTAMPLYEYECNSCGHRFERLQKFSDAPVEECPDCAQSVRRLISSSAIQFKGSGWYVTDYARKDSAYAKNSGRDSNKPSEKSATKASETSTESSTAGATKSSSNSDPAPSKTTGSSSAPSSTPSS